MSEWRARQKPKVSQATLGRLVGCDGSAIRHYEARRQALGLEICCAISRECGIALEKLVPAESLGTLREAAALLEAR